jgi:hypothetical protein
MPLRTQAYRPLCGQPGCREIAGHRCLRCGRPLCDQHVPREPERRCDDCEAAYRDRSQAAQMAEALSDRRGWGTAAIIGLVAAVLVVVNTLPAVPAVLALLGLTGLFLWLLVAGEGRIARRERRRRAEFLRQRPPARPEDEPPTGRDPGPA